jgi:hypothetical protein
LPALERAEIVARPLLCQWTVEGSDVAAVVAIKILDDPVAASLAIGMNAHLAHTGGADGRIIEALTTLQAS